MIVIKRLPPVEYLRVCLSADFEAGKLTWKERPSSHFASVNAWRTWNTRWAGMAAFNVRSDLGYLSGTLDWKRYQAHRVLWKLATGEDPLEIDHIDGNPANNALTNLRSVGREENMRNLPVRSDNTSGIPGVSWVPSRNRWVATIGKRTIGRFLTLEAAQEARATALASGGYHENHGARIAIGGVQ